MSVHLNPTAIVDIESEGADAKVSRTDPCPKVERRLPGRDRHAPDCAGRAQKKTLLSIRYSFQHLFLPEHHRKIINNTSRYIILIEEDKTRPPSTQEAIASMPPGRAIVYQDREPC